MGVGGVVGDVDVSAAAAGGSMKSNGTAEGVARDGQTRGIAGPERGKDQKRTTSMCVPQLQQSLLEARGVIETLRRELKRVRARLEAASKIVRAGKALCCVLPPLSSGNRASEWFAPESAPCKGVAEAGAAAAGWPAGRNTSRLCLSAAVLSLWSFIERAWGN